MGAALSSDEVVVYVEGSSYQMMQWGAERALGRGVQVRRFGHHDARELRRMIHTDNPKRAVILTDGFCPGCARPAPLSDFRDAIVNDGLVVVDDTQALGILGSAPGPGHPYGTGGGGTLRSLGLTSEGIVVIASLAKGFGAPLAVLSASEGLVARMDRSGDTRVHASPPSMADVAAAERALFLNATAGDRIRDRLAALVDRLRRRLLGLGISPARSVFPIQSLPPLPPITPRTIWSRLMSQGIKGIVHRKACGRGEVFSLIVTASHRESDVDRAASAIGNVLAGSPAA
jgi:8-amino-7-oxononanoate synthase